MNRVKRVFHVMEERVHVTGFSQGSWMTWKFVCDYADEVASVAPIGFGAGWPVNLSKSPVRINTFDDCFCALFEFFSLKPEKKRYVAPK